MRKKTSIDDIIINKMNWINITNIFPSLGIIYYYPTSCIFDNIHNYTIKWYNFQSKTGMINLEIDLFKNEFYVTSYSQGEICIKDFDKNHIDKLSHYINNQTIRLGLCNNI